ncbi:D-mandelate dehydrogenase [Colletotrichum orchidophilum]|uniref:D-mandelate dehydrogenase n=1 Tax=Colletotrichum orchidophilum TaxID=1209926 RepID=A0A1G4B843_9PEZI|nr:D-mandelate dehydrogenase [Colletotrichum orchidophilum]OHE97554.1 D-mandelate dehydrogenase [Colletotrichum orchidophilum]
MEFFHTGGGNEATAVAAVYLIISVFRQLDNYERMFLHNEIISDLIHSTQNAVDSFSKKIGIVGMGSIGQTVARQAAALGMEIHCIDRPNLRKTLEALRSRCIDEKALCDAIESGAVAADGLDVYYNE